jgi:hypothetical protein
MSEFVVVEGREDELSQDEIDVLVLPLLEVEPDTCYPELSCRITAIIGRHPCQSERRKIVASTFKRQRLEFAKARREEDIQLGRELDLSSSQFLVLTSYTDDAYYNEMGQFCAANNSAYCASHGYLWREIVMPLADMMTEIEPREFASYHKIFLMLQLMTKERDYLRANNVHYLMWIDSDAVVIDPSISLQSIVARAHGTDLIIAEDMHTACKLNAGVFLLRVGDWGLSYLQTVWDDERYFQVRHYEQSGMAAALTREGLNWYTPFHSYVSGDYNWKHFSHVCILPRNEFNTCIMDDDDLLGSRKFGLVSKSRKEAKDRIDPLQEKAKFIFHPAGRRQKLQCLRQMVACRAATAAIIKDAVVEAQSEALIVEVAAEAEAEVPGSDL